MVPAVARQLDKRTLSQGGGVHPVAVQLLGEVLCFQVRNAILHPFTIHRGIAANVHQRNITRLDVLHFGILLGLHVRHIESLRQRAPLRRGDDVAAPGRVDDLHLLRDGLAFHIHHHVVPVNGNEHVVLPRRQADVHDLRTPARAAGEGHARLGADISEYSFRRRTKGAGQQYKQQSKELSHGNAPFLFFPFPNYTPSFPFRLWLPGAVCAILVTIDTERTMLSPCSIPHASPGGISSSAWP